MNKYIIALILSFAFVFPANASLSDCSYGGSYFVCGSFPIGDTVNIYNNSGELQISGTSGETGTTGILHIKDELGYFSYSSSGFPLPFFVNQLFTTTDFVGYINSGSDWYSIDFTNNTITSISNPFGSGGGGGGFLQMTKPATFSGDLGNAMQGSTGSIFVIFLISAGLFLSFYIIDEIIELFYGIPDERPKKKK